VFDGIKKVLAAHSEALPKQQAALQTQREILELLRRRNGLDESSSDLRLELDAQIAALYERQAGENDAIHGQLKSASEDVPWFEV
jgi:hypothetical protein